MTTNRSVHTNKSMLTVTVIGAKVGGLRKLELIPGGGGPTGTPDKSAWSWIRAVAVQRNTVIIEHSDLHVVAMTWPL